MRKEIRIIGIDDSPFDKKKKGDVLVVGTIFRGGSFMDGLVSTKIRVDGRNSTDKLIRMIRSCKFYKQLQAILLDGVALGGFNVVDIDRLHKETKLPVLVVIRNFPDFERIYSVLDKLGMTHQRNIIEALPKPTKVGKIYIQHVGMTLERAKELIKLTAVRSYIPEPLRIAHIIGAGIVKGESRGRA